MGGEKPRFSSRVPAKTCMTEINQYLMCQLCSGYLVDATAIIECQHTFCKSCILKYLDTNSYCPICDVQLNKAKPHLSLRVDTTLQHLVYKLVPGLFVSEVRRRREFLSKLPADGLSSSADSSSAGGSGGTATTTTPVVELEETEDLCVLGLDDAVSLSLEYLKSRDEDTKGNVVGAPATNKSTCSDKANDRRYLQCPAAVSVGLLKKFIRMKYGLSDDYRVDLLYNGDRDNNLENDLTLLDLAFIYKWKKTEPMCFHYQIFDRPVKAQPVRPGTKRPATFMMDEPPDDDETASGPQSGNTSMTTPSKLARISATDTTTTTNSNNNNSNNNTTGTSSQSNKRSTTTTTTTTTTAGNTSSTFVSASSSSSASTAASSEKTEMIPPSPPRKLVKSPSRSRSITSEDREPSPPQTRSSLTLKLSKRFDTSKRRRSSTSSNASSSRSEDNNSSSQGRVKNRSEKSSSSTSCSASSSSASSSPISPREMPSLKISLKHKYHNNHHHHHHHHKHKHKSKDKEKREKHKGHKTKGKTMVTRGDTKEETKPKEPVLPPAKTLSHNNNNNASSSNNTSGTKSINQTNIPKGTTITGTAAPPTDPKSQPASTKVGVKVPKLPETSAGGNGRQPLSASETPSTPLNPTPTHSMTVPESVQLQVPKSVTLIPVNPNAPTTKAARHTEKPQVNRNTFTHPITNKSLHQITVTEVPPPKVPANQQQQNPTPTPQTQNQNQGAPPSLGTNRTFTDTSPGKHFNAPDGMEITKIYCDKNSSFEAAGKKLKGKGLDITISPSPGPPCSGGSNASNGNKGNAGNKKILDESLTFTHKRPGQPQQQQQSMQTSQKLLKQLGQNVQMQNTLRNLQAQGTKAESGTKSRRSSLSIEAAKPGTVSSVEQQKQIQGSSSSHPFHPQQHRKTIGNLDSSIAIYEVGSVRKTPTPPKEKGLVVTPIPNRETPKSTQSQKKVAEGKQQGQNLRKLPEKLPERKKEEQSDSPLDLSGKSSRSPTEMKEMNLNRPPTPSRSPSNNSPKRENPINKNNNQPAQAAQTQTILSIAQTLAQKHHLQQQQQQQQQQQNKKQKQMPPPSGSNVLHSKSSSNPGMSSMGSSSNSGSMNSRSHSLSPPMIPMPNPSPPGNFNPLRNLVTLSDAASCLHKLSNASLNSSLNQLAVAAGLCPPGHPSSAALSPPAQQMMPPQNPFLPSSLSGLRGNPLSPNLSSSNNSPLNPYPKSNLLSPPGWPGSMNMPRGLLSSSLSGTGSSLSPPLSNHLFSSLTGTSAPMPNPSTSAPHPPRATSLRIPNPKLNKEKEHNSGQGSLNKSQGGPAWSPMSLYAKGLADNNKSLISSQASHILRSSSLTTSGNGSGRQPKINGNMSGLDPSGSSNPTTFVAPSAIKPLSKSQGQMAKNAIPNSMKISNFLPPPQSKANGPGSNAPATITSSSSNLAKYLSNLPPLMTPQSPPHSQSTSNSGSNSGEKNRLKPNNGSSSMNMSSLNNSSYTYPLSSSILNANAPGGGILPPKNFTNNNLMSARTLPVSVATAGAKQSSKLEGSQSEGNSIGFTLSIENSSPHASNVKASRGATQPQNQAVRHIPNPSLLLSNRQNNNSICQSLLTGSSHNNAVNNHQQVTVPKPMSPVPRLNSPSSSHPIESSSFSISNLTGGSKSQRPLAEEIGKIEKIVQEKKEMLQELGKTAREPISDMEKILEELRKIPFERIQAQKEAEKLLAQKEGERAHALREAEKEKNQREAAEKLARKELLEKAEREKIQKEAGKLLRVNKERSPVKDLGTGIKTDRELVKIQMDKEAGKIQGSKVDKLAANLPLLKESLSVHKDSVKVPEYKLDKMASILPQKETTKVQAVENSTKVLGTIQIEKEKGDIPASKEQGKFQSEKAAELQVENAPKVAKEPENLNEKISIVKIPTAIPEKALDGSVKSIPEELIKKEAEKIPSEGTKLAGEKILFQVDQILEAIKVEQNSSTNSSISATDSAAKPRKTTEAVENPMDVENIAEKSAEFSCENTPENPAPALISQKNGEKSEEISEKPSEDMPAEKSEEKRLEEEPSEEKLETSLPQEKEPLEKIPTIPETVPEPMETEEPQLNSKPEEPSQTGIMSPPKENLRIVEEKAFEGTPIPEVISLPNNPSVAIIPSSAQVEISPVPEKAGNLDGEKQQSLTHSDSEMSKTDEADVIVAIRVESPEKITESVEESVRAEEEVSGELEEHEESQREEPVAAPIEVNASISSPLSPPDQTGNVTLNQLEESPAPAVPAASSPSPTVPENTHSIPMEMPPSAPVPTIANEIIDTVPTIIKDNEDNVISEPAGEAEIANAHEDAQVLQTEESEEDALCVDVEDEPMEESSGTLETEQASEQTEPVQDSSENFADITHESLDSCASTEESLGDAETHERKLFEVEESAAEHLETDESESKIHVEETSAENLEILASADNSESQDSAEVVETQGSAGNLDIYEPSENSQSSESAGNLQIDESATGTLEIHESAESLETPESAKILEAPESAEMLANPESAGMLDTPESAEISGSDGCAQIEEQAPEQQEILESAPEEVPAAVESETLSGLENSAETLKSEVPESELSPETSQSENVEAFSYSTQTPPEIESEPFEQSSNQPDGPEDNEPIIVPEIPEDFDESSDDLVIDPEAIATPADSTDGNSIQTEPSPAPAPEEDSVSQNPSESSSLIQPEIQEKSEENIPLPETPSMEESEPMEVDEPFELSSFSPAEKVYLEKIDEMESKGEIIPEEEAGQESTVQIDRTDLQKTASEQVHSGDVSNSIIPKSYNLLSQLSQVPVETPSEIVSEETPSETISGPTREEEESLTSHPEQPPKMLSPKQENIKKELLENMQDEDSMETDPFLHPNLELPMDVDEEEKDLKPLPLILTKTDEEERTASELSFIPSDIPEDHQQPLLGEENSCAENGLLDSSSEMDSSSHNDEPDSPVKVELKKMENLEKVAAGLLASAANSINNNNNNSFTNSGVGLPCDIPIGTATTTV